LLIGFIVAAITLTLILLVPDVSRLKEHNPGKTAFMEYREQEWQRAEKNYTVRQQWVPLSRISTYLIAAVVIAEDDKFWGHEGFDFEAIQHALKRDMKEKTLKFGASTISQQLVKNLYLSPEKSLFRKLREAVITWRLEKTLSKRRILELYLNLVEWGDRGIFGIETASRHYYGKSASDLNPYESARLAAILPNPRKYNPLAESRYIQSRVHFIVSVMEKRGIAGPESRGARGENPENVLPERIDGAREKHGEIMNPEVNDKAGTNDTKQ